MIDWLIDWLNDWLIVFYAVTEIFHNKKMDIKADGYVMWNHRCSRGLVFVDFLGYPCQRIYTPMNCLALKCNKAFTHDIMSLRTSNFFNYPKQIEMISHSTHIYWWCFTLDEACSPPLSGHRCTGIRLMSILAVRHYVRAV